MGTGMRRVMGTVALVLAVGVVRGQEGGYSPGEAAARMTLPEGFRAGVFASEPEVRQPVAACFDERGRMWVIEYLQYPNPAGLKPVEVDVYLRTKYDRVPEPPPRGPRGADRIKILEDTNGDGRADKVTTFVEGLNLASGIAVGHGGVYVGQAPYLLFYPDKNRDDEPDGDPEVLLTGFGMEDAHATVNSLAWGPDGWLYGAQGSTVTARIGGVEFQQGIWRYEPKEKRFELFAEGGGNTWGLDFDRAGNLFGSSNGGFIAFHMEQGGYYWKGFAKHGPLHNPRAYGYFDCLPYEGAKQGGHVTPGGIIYKGGQFPKEFDGVFLGANLLSNTAYWHPMEKLGSTFRARFGGTLVDAHDPWFRPIDLLTGPDGAVYLVDWYDRRASHLDPRDNWDRSNGRIYRITHGEAPMAGEMDLATWETSRLLELNAHGNDWWPEMARRILWERGDGSAVEGLRTLVREGRDPIRLMRDLWALDACGGLDDETAGELLGHPVAKVRRWVVRRLGDDGRMNRELGTILASMARGERDAAVRAQLAASCQRWGSGETLPILAGLIWRDEDVDDPHVPMMVWWAMEKQMRTDRAGVVDLLVASEAGGKMMVGSHLMGRLARALAESGSEADWEQAARLLAVADEGVRGKAIEGLEKGLEGRRLERVPGPMEGAVGTLLGGGVQEIRLAARLGSDRALSAAMAGAKDVSLPEKDRGALMELVGAGRSEEGRKFLVGMLREGVSPGLQSPLLGALSVFGEPEVGQAVVHSLGRLEPGARRRGIDLLCGRASWARELVERLGQDDGVALKEIDAGQAGRIVGLGDEVLRAEFERKWGRVKGTGEKGPRIAEVRGMLPEGDKGDARRGAVVFREQCAGCHKMFGEGEAIGPDLTGVDRSLDFLLASVIDPSAAIRKEYMPVTVAMADGRVLTGLVVEESEKSLTLFDSRKEKTVVAREEIEEMRGAEVSVMPEGLVDELSETQVRDLFKFLQGAGPPG